MLYGAEYEVSGSARPSGFGDLHDKDVPCAVCRRRGKFSVIMIPGKCVISKIKFAKQSKILKILLSIYITCKPLDQIIIYFSMTFRTKQQEQ